MHWKYMHVCLNKCSCCRVRCPIVFVNKCDGDDTDPHANTVWAWCWEQIPLDLVLCFASGECAQTPLLVADTREFHTYYIEMRATINSGLVFEWMSVFVCTYAGAQVESPTVRNGLIKIFTFSNSVCVACGIYIYILYRVVFLLIAGAMWRMASCYVNSRISCETLWSKFIRTHARTHTQSLPESVPAIRCRSNWRRIGQQLWH